MRTKPYLRVRAEDFEAWYWKSINIFNVGKFERLQEMMELEDDEDVVTVPRKYLEQLEKIADVKNTKFL